MHARPTCEHQDGYRGLLAHCLGNTYTVIPWQTQIQNDSCDVASKKQVENFSALDCSLQLKASPRQCPYNHLPRVNMVFNDNNVRQCFVRDVDQRFIAFEMASGRDRVTVKSSIAALNSTGE